MPQAARAAPGRDDGERRGERPAVEIVGQARDGECQHEREDAEREHGPVVCVFHPHRRLHAVTHGDQKHDREQPVGDGDGTCDAQELARHHRPAAHRLAHDRDHRLVLDLPRQAARGREGGQEQAGEKERAQPEVDEQLVVVLERVSGDVDVEH